MADQTLFRRLKRLFSTDVIIRSQGGNQLKVADVQRMQSTGNLVSNVMADRFRRLWSTTALDTAYPSEGIQVLRRELFTDYEQMEADGRIGAALDIYSDEATTKDEFGDTITVKSDNPKTKEVLNNLFYDVLNIEFNLQPWVRHLCKYGDLFLKLDIMEKFGIINTTPLSPYQVIRQEKIKPETGLPDVQYFLDDSLMGPMQRSALGNSNKEPMENYEVGHFRMLTDTNFLPYGRSILEPIRKVWKQIMLLEDAMLIHKIMRAPEKRIFKIDVGNIPPHEIDAYMQQIMQQSKKIPFIDANTGQYNLKFNMQNLTEDFYIPHRGGNGGTQIENIAGLVMDFQPDLEYLKGILLAGLRIPKAFLNMDDALGSKATLAAEDVRFSRSIERIQRVVISELTKIAIVHLYVQGFRDADLLDFEITMTTPSTIYEREKIELWQTKVTLAKDMMDAGLLSKHWIFKNILNMTDDDYEEEKIKVLNDARFSYRSEQIKNEGNDPVQTGKSYGTSHDIASLYKTEPGEENIPSHYNEKLPNKGEDDIKNSVSDESDEKIGRPKKNNTYGTHKHAMGRDPVGQKDRLSSSSIREKYGKQTSMIIESLKIIEPSLKKALEEDKFKMLDENNLLDNDKEKN